MTPTGLAFQSAREQWRRRLRAVVRISGISARLPTEVLSNASPDVINSLPEARVTAACLLALQGLQAEL
jgi:hypothetical protein